VDKIEQALLTLFEKHRIVFWYDAKKELRDEYQKLDLAKVEKIELKNNQFGVKYRILREQPEQNFLLYHEGPPPSDLDNWLLDVQLAYGEFRTDQAGLWLSQLGLGLEFVDVIKDHIDFFNSGKRRDALKDKLKPTDTPRMIRMKMLSICVSSEPRSDEILESLLDELSVERDQKFKQVRLCKLDTFLWEQLERLYDYKSETPGIDDFAIELFKSCYAMETGGTVKLNVDALVFLKRWKDSRRYHKAFETLSENYARLLNIEQDLHRYEYTGLLNIDYFRVIDQFILRSLVEHVVQRTVTAGECTLHIRQRRQSHWYSQFKHHYSSVDFAARFLDALNQANLSIENMGSGVESYADSWYQLDYFYRKFTYHIRKAGHPSYMQQLTQSVENLYANNYLLTVNDRWQELVDRAERWEAPPVPMQREFFRKWVLPYLEKENKVCVIISDGFRYEIGKEVLGLIRQQDRYEARIEPVLAMLPSYTQLGMAALLPNNEIRLAADKSGVVYVDGQSSQGTSNRVKILQKNIPGRAHALKAEELLKMDKDKCRKLFREHDVVYVYHNRIDTVGDKRDTEQRVFEAVEETLDDLMEVIKKLTAANASNLLLTSDHGFIYQDSATQESDFSRSSAAGEQVFFIDRRFILGKGLTPQPGLNTYPSSRAGLEGDLEIQVPKSINRLRLQGSGSRYVHGGSSIQETVVPVIHINKKRKSDVTFVDVEIFRGSTTVITSGQISVTFYQVQPVSDKVRGRTLRAGIYTLSGVLISDSHNIPFDLASTNPREREIKERFVLTRDAEQANNQEVVLRLEELHTGTSHYKKYKTVRYMMRRSITSDFDF
jgi:uncharacterized protein (TIGR02687 family)